jgi:hypothetical protein
MVPSANCKLCNIFEDYDHFFLKCKALDIFWKHIQTAFELCGYSKNMCVLKYIVLFYKNPKEYTDVNLIFSYIGFTIYKSYFISEERTVAIDSLEILRKELNIYLQFLKKKDIHTHFIQRFYNAL